MTTAINYTNGPAHMGHAYEGATSDAIARYARLALTTTTEADDDKEIPCCRFVTGADEHGEKIAKTAESEGRAPIEICDKVRQGRRRWSVVSVAVVFVFVVLVVVRCAKETRTGRDGVHVVGFVLYYIMM